MATVSFTAAAAAPVTGLSQRIYSMTFVQQIILNNDDMFFSSSSMICMIIPASIIIIFFYMSSQTKCVNYWWEYSNVGIRCSNHTLILRNTFMWEWNKTCNSSKFIMMILLRTLRKRDVLWSNFLGMRLQWQRLNGPPWNVGLMVPRKGSQMFFVISWFNFLVLQAGWYIFFLMNCLHIYQMDWHEFEFTHACSIYSEWVSSIAALWNVNIGMLTC